MEAKARLRVLKVALLSAMVGAACAPAASPSAPGAGKGEPTLEPIYRVLASKRFVDLTHPFAPGIPHWPGLPDEKRETIYGYDEGEGRLGKGFFAQIFTHVGQWGTHVDPPAHFVRGLRTVDQIDVKEMILPLVVIDLHERAAADPDTTLTVEDVRDWSKRWPDAARMQNKDAKGVAHCPGWSLAALRLLYEERKITASGHEPTDTDPGIATSKDDYSLETYVLGTNHYQIELLTNLDQVPEAGAIVVASFPRPKGGSGFPARVFAILP
jgi:kynurenine formamidase